MFSSDVHIAFLRGQTEFFRPAPPPPPPHPHPPRAPHRLHSWTDRIFQKKKRKKRKKERKRIHIAYLRGQTEFFRKKGSTSFAFVDRLNFVREKKKKKKNRADCQHSETRSKLGSVSCLCAVPFISLCVFGS